MKKIILAMMLAVPALAIAQGPKNVEASKLVVSNAVQWESTERALGVIKQHVATTAEFKFVNKSKQPVIITNVQPSCGCTAADYTKEPIPAGGVGVIKATYNAASTGSFRKQVTVSISGEPNPVVLVLSGVVE